MGDLIGLLAVLIIIGMILAGIAWWTAREHRREAREAAQDQAEKEHALWTVTQRAGTDVRGRPSVTRVYVELKTASGAVLQSIWIGEVYGQLEDWTAKLLELRLKATTRADLLNSKAL